MDVDLRRLAHSKKTAQRWSTSFGAKSVKAVSLEGKYYLEACENYGKFLINLSGAKKAIRIFLKNDSIFQYFWPKY
jgi:hypothetical protein